MEPARATSLLVALLSDPAPEGDDSRGARRVRDLVARAPALAGVDVAAIAAARTGDPHALPGAKLHPQVDAEVVATFDQALASIGEGSARELVEQVAAAVRTHLHSVAVLDAGDGLSLADALCLAAVCEDASRRADASDRPLRFVELTLRGRQEFVLDASGHGPRAVIARAAAVSAELDRAAAALLDAANAPSFARIARGSDRQLFLLPAQIELARRLLDWQQRLETRLLQEAQGALVPLVAVVDAGGEALADAADLDARLIRERERQARTPLLAVLDAPGAFGPFAGPASDGDESDRAQRELAGFVAGASVPGSASGSWPADECLALADIRVVATASSTPLARLIHPNAFAEALLRGAAIELARANGLCAVASGDDLCLAGAFTALARVVGDIAMRGGGAPRGVALAIGMAAARPDDDPARLAAASRAAIDAAIAAGPGRSQLLGAMVATRRVPALLALGEQLVDLAVAEPNALRALLAASAEIVALDTPLAVMDRLRGGVHALAARLGVGAGACRDESLDGALRGLAVLIREFPGMFDSGAARLPLAYAVLRSQCRPTESES